MDPIGIRRFQLEEQDGDKRWKKVLEEPKMEDS